MTNLTAYSEGLTAAFTDDDADETQITECPYDEGSSFRADWYRGYNDWHEGSNDRLDRPAPCKNEH